MIRLSTRLLAALLASTIVLLSAGTSSRANPAVYELGSDPMVGFNLISWWDWGSAGTSVWQNAVQQVYNAGFREISISPVRYFNMTTGVISTSGSQTPQLTHINDAVVRAKSLGMRVTLNPFVEPQGFSTWRGFWNPTAGSAVSNQFWSDYQNYLVAVAQIARNNNVDVMTIGTEMKALNGNPAHNASWSAAIDAVRNPAQGDYHGPLGYAANWDDYQNSNLQATIWEDPDIDFIGIDSYFQNMVSNSAADASGTYPNSTFINTVTTAWNNKLNNETLPYAAARKGGKGMPVSFTEIGYLPRNRTAVNPQGTSQGFDSDEQKMVFVGLMNALDGRAGKFFATDIWHWGMPGTGTDGWDMGLVADVSPNNAGADPNNISTTQWLQSFMATATLPPLPGDFDRNSAVDAADFVFWRKNLGRHVVQYNAADGSGNGIVDAADYAVWRAGFGNPFGSGAAAAASVPEPMTFWLLLSTGLAVSLPNFRYRTARR
jgi:Glycoside Hydrolase Family 113